MRKSFFAVLCAAAVCVAGLMAAEPAPEAFVTVMKSTGASLQKLGKDVDAKDYDAVAAGAASIKAGFAGVVGKYFTEKKIADALESCTAAYKAAGDLEAAAKAKNDAGIADARKALTGACASCHTAHREKQPDGTFLVK